MYGAQVLVDSLDHSGEGSIPGQRYRGGWDLRAHRARVINVDHGTLTVWQRLVAGTGDPEQASLLQPVTLYEEKAIEALANVKRRLAEDDPWISSGYHESGAKRDGLIRWQQGTPESLEHLVIQGPHFGIATPFAKQPRVPYRSNNDWNQLDLRELSSQFLPGANYALTGEEILSRGGQDHRNGVRHVDFYRLTWRSMIAFNTERSLFAALLPPGPSHVHAVHSLVLSTSRLTVLNAGFWASLPIDYLLRITGRSHLQVAEAKAMPAPAEDHPLAESLLLRVLRLNCLTEAYADLWQELFDGSWIEDAWASQPAGLEALGRVEQHWSSSTPLRTEQERRAALVEIDALVSVWLGIDIDELLAIYRSRFPILLDREAGMYFDSAGRRLAADPYAFGIGQQKEHFVRLDAHLDDPVGVAAPEGYSAPFVKADRPKEMRQAHAVFSARLQAAKDRGWRP
nr:hypothetical protein Ade03nite_81380 [Actinoplanes derwentensis]